VTQTGPSNYITYNSNTGGVTQGSTYGK
jgi:hypothetical protein